MAAFVQTALTQRVSLAPLTSLGVGGPAEFFARVTDGDRLPELLDWAARQSLPVTVLGGGSNVVVSDAGVPGLVLSLEPLGESIECQADRVEVSVGAGEPWDAFVQRCVERGWAGLECLSGIPGRVGATPIQNVGAYGQDVGATLLSVDVHDAKSGRRITLPHAECGFGYRTSRFKSADGAHHIVLGARFGLLAGGEPCTSYPEIGRAVATAGSAPPSLKSVREVVLMTRRAKSMLLDPRDENGRSCGSFFLNPELDAAQFDALAGRAPAPPPGYRQADGRVKVPAAWLIEQAGFRRGQRFGSVGISSRHALALVCHTGATAAQLVAAAHRVRDGVAEALGIRLLPEPRFFGFGTPSDELPPE
jgi:UDP-N-acetylmuramate dehydrogenase